MGATKVGKLRRFTQDQTRRCTIESTRDYVCLHRLTLQKAVELMHTPAHPGPFPPDYILLVHTRAFVEMDVDGTGTLSLQQLRDGLAKLGIYISEARASVLLKHFARSEGEGLHYYEFVRMLSTTMVEIADTRESGEAAKVGGSGNSLVDTLGQISQALFHQYRTLSNAFKALNRDHSKLISPEELQRGLKEIGVDLSDQELRAIVSR